MHINGNSSDSAMDENGSEVESTEQSTVKRQRTLTKEQVERMFDDVERHPLNVDEKWYLCSLTWWKKLGNAVKQGYIDDVPPIQNDRISTSGADGNYYLMPNLVEKIDYITVPERVFKELLANFGVDNEKRDVIERVVIYDTFRKNAVIEIYPRVLTVRLARDRTKSSTLTLRNDTVGQLRDRALKALGVDKESMDKIRFYIEHGDKYELLEIGNADEHVSSLFSSAPTVIVDIVDEMGNGFISRPRSHQLSTYNDDSSSSTANFTRGVCGLQNLGNTCFMASAIQCLSNVACITEYFLSDRYLNDLNEQNPLGTHGELARVYGQLMHSMWSGRHATFIPRALKSTIGRFAPRFSGFSQQDSQELLAFLLDGLHEDLNRVKKKPYIEEEENNDGKTEKMVAEEAWETYKKRNDSVIVDRVHGQLKSTLVCPQCQKVSIKFDPFCFLSVPVPPREKMPRQMTVILLFNPCRKWAKFSVTLTQRTTVEEVVNGMKNSLNMNDLNLVLFTVSDSSTGVSILDPSSRISRISSDSPNKILYAAALSRPVSESVLVIARPFFTSSSALTLPMIFSLDPSIQSEGPLEENDNFTKSVHQEVTRWFVSQYSSEEPPTTATENEDEEQRDQSITPSITLLNEDSQPFIRLEYEGGFSFKGGDYKGSNLVEREINVVTKQDVSLVDCVSLFTKEEQLSEQDSWYCPTCKEHVRATKKLDLWKLPEILIVHLKRFQYSRWSREKIDTNITIPTKDFHLRDLLANDSHEDAVYDLVAVSHHMGGLGGGHYTASALNGDKWYHFNDSCASPMDTPPCGPSNGQSPYMLFYRRRQPPSPVHSDEHLEMETDD